MIKHMMFCSGKDTQSFQKGGTAQGQTVFVRGFNKYDGEDQVCLALSCSISMRFYALCTVNCEIRESLFVESLLTQITD